MSPPPLTSPLSPLSMSPPPHMSPPLPNPGLGSSTDSDSDWYHLLPPKKRPKLESSKEFGQAHEDQVMHPQQSNPGPLTDSNPDLIKLLLLPLKKRPILASSNEFGQAYEDQVVHAQQLNPGQLTEIDWTNLFGPDELLPPLNQPNRRPLNLGTSNPGPSNPRLPTGPMYGVVTAPSPSLGLPMELDDDEDLQAAIYASKGKAKELRRYIPGTARDVGNAVQRELQSVQRHRSDSNQVTKFQY